MNSTFTHEDVELFAKKTLYKGFFKMEEYRFKHRLFDGGWSGEIIREVFERGHAVVVLPYDPINDKVVLIEQIRIPVLESAKSPWLFELVAGMIDAGQESEQVAIKELKEETGLDALSVTKVNQYFASPGGTSERFDFYWAAVDSSNADGNYGLPEEHEDIKVHVVDREFAYKMMTDGQIDNASTVIGLQWLQLNYQDLLESHHEK
ncbi:ADP-ribose diphosphatase [Shewanella abyssi]|uniref:ADP-ribose diphosphatase n=1 Tax=Shewanella abyssi TaxID=311789 RepID=UPI002010B98C|nr:ADP-ribose diphosphatase [Shewanella abyssi]MCL1051419.1 ADP-ribose diphosphatase [Shewanella abyssi]